MVLMIDSELPRISIITPSFNQGDFIEATVRSVINQRYLNLEYIMMDGGSTDDTLLKLQPYIERFSHFESGPDGGQSAAIAKGFSLASGEIMGFLNSDDVLLPGALNFVADFFNRHPKVDLIYSHRCIIDKTGNVTGHWILPKHSNFLMKRWDLIPQETCFWRRKLFEKHGNVNPGFRFAMDYDLFVRYMRSGHFRRVNRFLAAFRVHSNSKTTTQLFTIGHEEIKKVQTSNSIRLIPLLGDLFSVYVQASSAFWLLRHKSMPGLPPGINYNVNNTWSGK